VNEPELGLGDVAYPSLPASITTYTDPLGYTGDVGLLQRQQLVVVPGQFLSDTTIDATGSGTQVLYGSVDTQITYSDSSDWTRPSITSTLGELDNGTATFAVRASDAAGVQRVLVLVRTDISDWAPLDLTFGGTTWQATLAVPGATTFDYLVQVVDINGNVATSTGKGRGLDPFVAPDPEPATVSVMNAGALEGDAGTTARSVSVVLDRPAPGPITVGYTVTAGTAAAGTDFTATSGSVTLATGDLATSVAFDIAGDTTTEAPESVIITLTSVTASTGLLADATGTFTIVDDDPVAAVCSTTDNTGIAAWWPGERVTTGQVGPQLSGADAYTNGRTGRAFNITPNTPLAATGVAQPTTGLTLELWVKPQINTGAVQTLISRWSGVGFTSASDDGHAYNLELYPNSELVFETDDVTTRVPEQLRVSAPQLVDGSFHHVAATWTPTAMTLYIDGVQVATKPSQGGQLQTGGTTPVRIGGPFGFTGVIDEPTIWTRALAPAEIGVIANAAGGKCP